MRDFTLRQELFSLKVRAKIDARIMACSVKAEMKSGGVFVSGFSMLRQTDAFIRATAEEVFPKAAITYDLRILSRTPLSFHEVIVPAAQFYKQPFVDKEDMLTEALYGCVVRTYFKRDGFIFAQHPDGYVGYVPEEALKKTTTARYLRWKNGECAIFKAPTPLDGVVVPPSAKLIFENNQIQLPSQRWYKTSARAVKRTDPGDPRFVNSVVKHAEVFRDTPYLWGGKTQVGIDCSGFVQSLVLQEGIKLPRDANMQAVVGEIVGYLPKYADLLPGDLLFFMNDKAHVFHVGIYLGNYNYLHSSGSKNIIRSSLLPGGENYLSRYGKTFAFARRVHA